MITKKKKKEYEAPELRIHYIQPNVFICQSPGGGGSEGTGDEPLVAINPSFDEVIDVGVIKEFELL